VVSHHKIANFPQRILLGVPISLGYFARGCQILHDTGTSLPNYPTNQISALKLETHCGTVAWQFSAR